MFAEIHKQLQNKDSSILTDVVAAVFTSIVKGLAAYYDQYISPNTSGGVRGLGLSYISYLSQLNADGTDKTNSQPYFVKVIQCCTALLKGLKPQLDTIIDRMYRYFLVYYYPSGKGDDNDAPDYSTPSAKDVESFHKLLLQTLDNITTNTIESLEDLADFNYLWAATLQDPVLEDVDYNNTNQNGKRDSPLKSDSIKHIAKELAWVFSQTTTSSTQINVDRKQRIINAAACVDLVTAALTSSIIPAPSSKRRRFGSGDNSRRSVGDESAAALKTILTGEQGRSSNSTAVELSRQLREKSKKSLLQATSDLLSSLTKDTNGPVQHKDIVLFAQNVASSVLSLLVVTKKNGKRSSPASQLLSFINSHESRRKSLGVLKNFYHNTISDKIRVTLSNTGKHMPKNEKALIMGQCICNLQKSSFIEPVGKFYHLSSTERNMLAPFSAAKSSLSSGGDNFIVRGLIYRLPEPKPVRRTIQINRLNNAPSTEAELKDLNEWTTAMMQIVSNSSSVKPSSWLSKYFENSESIWKKETLPVLRYFLGIVADECKLSLADNTISDTGKYKIQQGDVTPATVLMMYYLALEAIVRRSPSVGTGRQRFHSSLFSLCYFCLRKAKQSNGRCFLIEDIGDNPIEFYKLVELFIQVVKPIGSSEMQSLCLPEYLIKVLTQLKQMLVGMMWMSDDLDGKTESSFSSMVSNLREEDPTAWRSCVYGSNTDENPKPVESKDYMLVSFMIGEVINDITRRTSTLCQLLSISYPSITTKMSIELFKRVLCERTDIFYDRHPDQLMMCCLYAVLCAQSNTHARKARQQQPDVGFQKIAEAYMKMNRDDFGSEIPYTILHRIKNCSKQDDQFGDVISLHNNVFVPAVKSFWGVFKDKVLEAQTKEHESPVQANEEDEDTKSKEMDVETSDSQKNKLPVSAEGEKEVEQDSIAKNVDQQVEEVTGSKDNDQQEVEEVLETKDSTQLDDGDVVDDDEEEKEESKTFNKPSVEDAAPTKGGFTLPDQSNSSSSSSSEEDDEHEGEKDAVEKKADISADDGMDVDDDDFNNKQLDDYATSKAQDNSDTDSNDTMDDLIERDNINSQIGEDEDKEPLAYL